MIYSYIKEKLDVNNPAECFRLLREAERDVDRLRTEINNMWTYCCGCRSYAKVAEAYEGYTDNNRPVLRCGTCGSIWKFLD